MDSVEKQVAEKLGFFLTQWENNGRSGVHLDWLKGGRRQADDTEIALWDALLASERRRESIRREAMIEMRDACFTDMVKLIHKMVGDTPLEITGKDALTIFGAAVKTQGPVGFGCPLPSEEE